MPRKSQRDDRGFHRFPTVPDFAEKNGKSPYISPRFEVFIGDRLGVTEVGN